MYRVRTINQYVGTVSHGLQDELIRVQPRRRWPWRTGPRRWLGSPPICFSYEVRPFGRETPRSPILRGLTTSNHGISTTYVLGPDPPRSPTVKWLFASLGSEIRKQVANVAATSKLLPARNKLLLGRRWIPPPQKKRTNDTRKWENGTLLVK